MTVPTEMVRAKALLRRAVDFRGRTSRRDYWRLYAVLLPLGLVLRALLPAGFLTTLLLWALAIPLASATVRRLHDTGNSAWALLWGMIPFVGSAVEVGLTATRSTPAWNRYGPPPGTPEGAMPPLEVHRRTYLDADGNVKGHAWVDEAGNVVQGD